SARTPQQVKWTKVQQKAPVNEFKVQPQRNLCFLNTPGAQAQTVALGVMVGPPRHRARDRRNYEVAALRRDLPGRAPSGCAGWITSRKWLSGPACGPQIWATSQAARLHRVRRRRYYQAPGAARVVRQGPRRKKNWL